MSGNIISIFDAETPGFYVNQDACLDHELCVNIAPEIFGIKEYFAYIIRQPDT